MKVLEEKRDELKWERHLVHNAIQDEYLNHFVDVFQDIEDVKIRLDSRSFVFSRFHPEYDYEKELCTIYMDTQWLGKNEKHWRDVYLSYYTIQGNNEWELNRVITLGQIAQVLKNNKEDILNSINDIYDSYKPQMSKLDGEIIDIEKQIRTIEEQEQKDKFESKLKECQEGIEVDKKWINVSAHEDIQIEWFKIEKLNKGGKTYHIKFKYPGGVEWERERVKKQYIHQFINSLI